MTDARPSVMRLADPAGPLSPMRLTDPRPDRLLAYLGNGHLGIRVGRIPILGGEAFVGGHWSIDAALGVPALSPAPYPLAGDIVVGDDAASTRPDSIRFLSQELDIACGELTSAFTLELDGARVDARVTTFCSRTDPALVVQELCVRTDEDVDIILVATVDAAGIEGSFGGSGEIPPGIPPTADAYMVWNGIDGMSRCGIALATIRSDDEGAGPPEVRTGNDRIDVRHNLRVRKGRPVHLRTVVSMVPELAHPRPERQAGLLAARGIGRGWEELRDANHAAWADLWLARPLLEAPDPWQRLSDASFYYLHANASPASLAGTGVFGLAPTPGYHGYLGHTMWDVESFAIPPLVVSSPEAARALLRFRVRSAPAASRNAALHGYAGMQFPWEADFLGGDEAVPRWSKTDKDHISLDVGLALALYAAVTDDRLFTRLEGLGVIAGVAEWLLSRVERTSRGFEIRHARGPAEAPAAVDNDAFVNLAAITFLRRASGVVRALGDEPPADWERTAAAIVIPRDRRTGAIVNHDGYRLDEPLGSTPEAAAAFFPVGYRGDPEEERATLRYALRRQVDAYVGTPMFSALLGVHAAWAGRRRLAARLFERGYQAFFDDPFDAPDEFPADDDRFPNASPMLANLGAFLSSLYWGLPGLLPTPGPVSSWAERPVVLPAGWRSIEVRRLWVRGRPTRLVARHGASRAVLRAAGAPEETAAFRPGTTAGTTAGP